MRNGNICYLSKLEKIEHDFKNSYWGFYYYQREVAKAWCQVNSTLEEYRALMADARAYCLRCKYHNEPRHLPALVEEDTIQTRENRKIEQTDKDYWKLSLEIYVNLPKFSLNYTLKKLFGNLAKKRFFLN